MTQLDAAGLQPHFHAIGDRAVRECLDAGEHVGAIVGVASNGVGGVLDDGRALQVLDDHAPRLGRLVGVGRAQHRQTRDRAQRGEVLDRLMRGTVFAQADRVMRENVDDLHLR